MGLTQKLGTIPLAILTDASNNVGIGGSPSGSYKLEVTGTAKVSSTLLVSGAATFSSTVNVNGATANTNLNVLGVAGTMVGTTATNQQLRITAPTTTANAGAGIRFDASSGAKEATANIGVVNNATGNTGSLVFNVYNGGSDFPEQMRITSAGNVGIGTSSPNTWATNLVVYNNQLTITGGGYDGSFADSIFFGGNSEGTNYRNKISNSLSSNVVNQKMKFSIASGATTFVDVMTLVGNGNVGIGTSSPESLGSDYTTLDIKGKSGLYGGAIQLTSANGTNKGRMYTSNDTFWVGTQNSLPLGFFTADVERMRITSGGNVNINGSGFSDVKFYVKGSDATGSNYAALFVNGSASNLFNIRNDGAVQVFGSLSKGSGSFRIDHPLESMTETHQLVHSFIEGPRVDLIYRGKLTLVNGKAQANIDEVSTMTEGTFEALCREVQCFTTNESGWDLVKGKVIGNIIYIESQNINSTDEISWMVIGERKDKHMMDTDWTDDNGKVIVEPLKPIEPTMPSEPINQD